MNELDRMARPQPAPLDDPSAQARREVLEDAAAYLEEHLGDAAAPVIELLRRRDALGRAKYGTPLRVHNGRSAALDSLQEAADLLMYTTQGWLERPRQRSAWRRLQAHATRSILEALELRKGELEEEGA